MSPRVPLRTQRSTAAFATAMLGAVIAPIVNQSRDAPRDGFPLSHYPMFAAGRSHEIGMSFLRGVRADGTVVRIDPRLAVRGGMNQERKQLAARSVRDRADWPVVATALALSAAVWTNDNDFLGTGLPTSATETLRAWLGRS